MECTDTSARDKKVTELYVQVMKRFSKALLAVRSQFDYLVSICQLQELKGGRARERNLCIWVQDDMF